MSLDHAILGFLSYAPMTGYDLKKVFDTSVQHFWPADQAQIYRTLSGLEEEGWVEMELVHQDDRPDRKVYHITAAGRKELRDWLTTPLPPTPIREPELIQVFFAGQLSDEEILAMFERMADRMRKLLARYGEVAEEKTVEFADAVDSPREAFFWMLTLECGVSSARAYLAWLESVIQKIKDKEHPSN